MSRETQNPVYPDLVKHQALYEQTCLEYASLKAPQKPRAHAKKKKYNEEMQRYNDNLSRYNEKRAELRKKMEDIVLKSRAIFFAKQN